MLTKDDIHTLINIVIVDLMRVDLFPYSYITQGFVVLDLAQAKEMSYHN